MIITLKCSDVLYVGLILNKFNESQHIIVEKKRKICWKIMLRTNRISTLLMGILVNSNTFSQNIGIFAHVGKSMSQHFCWDCVKIHHAVNHGCKADINLASVLLYCLGVFSTLLANGFFNCIYAIFFFICRLIWARGLMSVCARARGLMRPIAHERMRLERENSFFLFQAPARLT